MAIEPMISAAKLEEVLGKRFRSKGTVHFDDLMAAIADIPAVDGATVRGDKDNNVPSKWISVKDRLPEKGGSYLVFSSKSKTVFTAHYWLGDRWANRANGQFITHWMPLPQPPKGE